ncbi:flagellar hook-length control protein FliK, partial [Candidatus Aerophobetes bacterium]|nr:flagellar hook-length control protein FliK [Candidatus Aerophobetes bacterium]
KNLVLSALFNSSQLFQGKAARRVFNKKVNFENYLEIVIGKNNLKNISPVSLNSRAKKDLKLTEVKKISIEKDYFSHEKQKNILKGKTLLFPVNYSLVNFLSKDGFDIFLDNSRIRLREDKGRIILEEVPLKGKLKGALPTRGENPSSGREFIFTGTGSEPVKYQDNQLPLKQTLSTDKGLSQEVILNKDLIPKTSRAYPLHTLQKIFSHLLSLSKDGFDIFLDNNRIRLREDKGRIILEEVPLKGKLKGTLPTRGENPSPGREFIFTEKPISIQQRVLPQFYFSHNAEERVRESEVESVNLFRKPSLKVEDLSYFVPGKGTTKGVKRGFLENKTETTEYVRTPQKTEGKIINSDKEKIESNTMSFFSEKQEVSKPASQYFFSTYFSRVSQLTNQILHYIDIMRSKKQSKALFFLKSKEFGDLRIHLMMEKSNLMLQIHVSETKTGEIIQNNLSYLRQNLEKEGIFLKEFTMDFSGNTSFSDEQKSQPGVPFPSGVEAGDNIFPDKEREESLQVNAVSYYVDYLV